MLRLVLSSKLEFAGPRSVPSMKLTFKAEFVEGNPDGVIGASSELFITIQGEQAVAAAKAMRVGDEYALRQVPRSLPG